MYHQQQRQERVEYWTARMRRAREEIRGLMVERREAVQFVSAILTFVAN